MLYTEKFGLWDCSRILEIESQMIIVTVYAVTNVSKMSAMLTNTDNISKADIWYLTDSLLHH